VEEIMGITKNKILTDSSGNLYYIPSGSSPAAGTEILTNPISQYLVITCSNNTGNELIPTDNSGSHFYFHMPTGHSYQVWYSTTSSLDNTHAETTQSLFITSSHHGTLPISVKVTLDSQSVEYVAARTLEELEQLPPYIGSNIFSISQSNGYLFISSSLAGAAAAPTSSTALNFNHQILINGDGTIYKYITEGLPDISNSSVSFNIDEADTTSFLISGSSTTKLYFSGSGKIGINTTDPQSGFDVVSDEVQFQKPGSRKGLKINNEGNIESFNKDVASAATGSEFILKYSRGTAITQASLDALGIVDGIEDDATATSYFNALKSADQNTILEKLESLGFINSPEVGDTLGSIRFIAESGSLAGFNSRVAGEAALIKAVVNSIDATGVQADLIFSVAGKEGASEQKLLLDATNNHELTGSLDVTSNLTIGAGIFHGGDNDTSLNFTDNAINFKVGNEILMQIIEHTQDKVLIGDGGDVDFRVVTNGQSISGPNPSLFVEGSSGNVGIGINTPTSKLHVVGNIWASGSSGHITASANISASGTVTGLTGSFSYGVILKSPNGSNFRFTVDDSGHLSVTGSAV
jgi:hypothetical protein